MSYELFEAAYFHTHFVMKKAKTHECMFEESWQETVRFRINVVSLFSSSVTLNFTKVLKNILDMLMNVFLYGFSKRPIYVHLYESCGNHGHTQIDNGFRCRW